MNLPGLIILALLFVGLFRDIAFLLYLVFVLQVFGSLALLPPSLTGDSSILPVSIAALFLVMKTGAGEANRQSAIRAMLDVRQMGLLCLFLLIAVIGAIVLPRAFHGMVRICTMRPDLEGELRPTTSNFTQSAYLILSTFTAVACCVLAKKPGFADTALKAILLGGCAVIATGLLDIIAGATGFSDLLTYFRTASYAFMLDNVVMGARRIVGLMPEASAYGAMAASFCALLLFLRPAYGEGLRRRVVPVAAAGCGVMACLSTSSTALVMMAALLLMSVFYRTLRVTPEGVIVKRTLISKAMLLGLLLVALCLVGAMESGWVHYIADFLDDAVFRKKNSLSYATRANWNALALKAVSTTGGAGVGVGSVRTSDFFINILSSTGYLGSLIFGLFLRVVFTRQAPASDARSQVIITALRLALITTFTGMVLAGTTPDFGILVGAIFGIILGLSQHFPRSEAPFRSP